MVVAKETGLFVSSGQELKCAIIRPFTEKETESLLNWCETVENAVKEYGLAE